uniref:Uncharacterized protein n=1 Tax=Tanacetum cinerariifolium TaxID=118510 RepID=A0A6L2LN89_TANCI|nr:hypothetical protein [Tanacetum cinerariifolium]
MPKVLLIAWERCSEIKHAFTDKQYQREEIQELMCKLHEDVRNINEELSEFTNSPSWDRSMIVDDKSILFNLGCALLRKKFKEDLFTSCIENEILQDFSEPSNDNTNVVNAPQEPFVVNQDSGIFCRQCTCELCGIGTHYGYNCPLKVPIIPNPEPFNNQTIEELPPSVPSFDPTCYSEDGNSFTYDSTSNLVHDSPNVFDPPPQLPFYSCEFCGNDARYGHYCTPQVSLIYPKPCYNQNFNFPQDFHDFQHQYLCCENYGVTHEPYQCQPINEDYYHEQNSCYDSNSFGFDQFQPQQYTINHPIFNSQNDLFDSQNKIMEQLTSICDMVGQIFQKKEEEKQIEEEQAANARYWKIPTCYDDDDDDYTFAITPNEPDNSLSMGDEHLDTIPVTELDEFIKSSVENLVPNSSEPEGEPECDVLACEVFTTFSNILFDVDYDFYSSDDQSFSDEDFPKEIYSNPLFDEEINSMKIDPHHFNAESDLIESLLNHDSSIISSFSKIDSLFDEFAGELTLLKSIPPGIDETDYDPEEETHFIKILLYDNSSPRPPKEFVSDNSDAAIKSFSPSPIPDDDHDSKRDILFLDELLNNNSLSLPKNESFYFDIPSSSRPPAKPPDASIRFFELPPRWDTTRVRKDKSGDEHLSIIPETKSDELIKSSVKNLVPILSESEVTSDNESECDVPVKDESSPIFTTFSNPLFDCNDDFTSSDDESLSNEDIDPHYFNAESNLIESLPNQDTLFDSSPKFDYLEEFSGEFMPTSIINEERIKREHEEHISLMENDSQREEIDLFLDTGDLMPPGSKNNDYDSKRDIHILKELLSNDTPPLPKNESFNFDHDDDPLFPRPPPEPPDVDIFFEPDSDVLKTKAVKGISEHYVLMPNILPTLPTFDPLYPVYDTLPSFSSENEDKVFKPGILEDKVICDLDKTPDLSQRSLQNCPKCGHPVDEPFVGNQNPGKISSQSPPQINHHCCYGCGDSLEGIFCHQCTCKLCGNGAHYGYNCPLKVPIIPDLEPFNNQTIKELPSTVQSFDPKYDLVHDSPNVFDPPSQLPFCSCELRERCSVTHEVYQCQPMNEDYYHKQNSCDDHNSFGFDQFQPQQYTKKEEEKQIEEDQAANARYWKIPACYDDDDDDYTFSITPSKPDNSLSMRDEHLDTIPAAESDKFIKSSVENLVPNPSESEGEHDDDQSFSDEDFSKEIYSNPLFDEKIVSMKIDPHHFNAESDLIESLLNHDSSIISSSKIDSLFDELASELTLLKSIPPGIDKTDCYPEEETHFIKRLLYDNLSSRPPKEFGSENSDAAIESFSPYPIPVEDSDSLLEEIDLSFNLDYPMPPGIEEDDYDSERDILIFEEFLSNNSLSLPENESFHFDIPSFSRPPAKPPDGNTGILNVKMMGDISKQKVPMPRLMFTKSSRNSNQEKSPDLLPHQGLEAF